MVHLISLKMQNVRSVGDCPHALNFLRPLTLIQGPNGTGKTTILESLNYVTSGKLPCSDIYFVHDPSIAGKSRTDALVQLKFSDFEGYETIATRRMACSIAKTSTGRKFQSDESTIKRAINGTDTTVSSKVSDFGSQVVELMGVSSSVLNHVIFCHQEEANWPMSEPKKLKDIFDKIFDVAEYVTVVDNLRTESKSLQNEIKKMDGELPHYLNYVEQRNSTLSELSRQEANFRQRKDRLRELNSKVKHLTERATELKSKQVDYQQTNTDYVTTKALLKSKKEVLKSIEVPDFAGARQDLQREIDSLSASEEFADDEKKRKNVTAEIASIEERIKATDSEIAKVQLELNECKMSRTRREELVAEVRNLEDRLQKQHGPFESDVFEGLRELLRKAQTKKQEVHAKFAAERDALSKRLEAATSDVARAKGTKAAKENESRHLRGMISDIEKRLIHLSAGNLEAIEAEIAQLEATSQNLGNPEDAEREYTRLVDEARKQEQELDRLERVHKTVVKLASDRASFNSQIGKSEAALKTLFDVPPTKNFFMQVETIRSQLDRKIRNDDKDLKTLSRELGALDRDVEARRVELRMLEEDVEKKRANIENVRLELHQVAGKLQEVRERLKELRDDLGEKQGSSFLYKKWEREVAVKKHCPLCERQCTPTATDVEHLVAKLQKWSLDLPSEMTQLESLISELDGEEAELRGLLPLVDDITSLETRIAAGKKAVDGAVAKKSTLEASHAEAETRLAAQQKKLTAANVVLGDAKLLDRLLLDIAQSEEHLAQLGNEDIGSADQVETQMEAARIQKETTGKALLRAKVASERTKAMATRLSNLRDSRLKLGEQALQSASLANEKSEKEAALVRLTLEIGDNDAEIEHLRVLETDLRRKMHVLKAEIEEAECKAAKSEQQLTLDVERLKPLRERLRTAGKGFDETIHGLEDRLDGLAKEKGNAEKRKLQLEGDFVSCNNKLDKLRLLNDQLRKLTVGEEVEVLTEQLDKLRIKMDVLGAAAQELSTLRQELDRANNELHREKGAARPLEEQMERLRISLDSKTSKNAYETYRDKYAERCITEDMSRDLDSYAKCFDDAIIAFHTLKMEQINDNLAEYWRKVYQGNDIETIRIKSDPKSVKEKRKSYEYNVVMVVDGKELEMRDRCSAGQKVLASILIRLSLADVFAVNCPILALDEPTTNLDIDKVDNLADMLERLVSERQARNGDGLQLVVITHDAHLVMRLHRACRPEYIYGLSKDECGITHLKKHTYVGDYDED